MSNIIRKTYSRRCYPGKSNYIISDEEFGKIFLRLNEWYIENKVGETPEEEEKPSIAYLIHGGLVKLHRSNKGQYTYLELIAESAQGMVGLAEELELEKPEIEFPPEDKIEHNNSYKPKFIKE